MTKVDHYRRAAVITMGLMLAMLLIADPADAKTAVTGLNKTEDTKADKFPEGTPQEFIDFYNAVMNSQLDELDEKATAARRVRSRIPGTLLKTFIELDKLSKELRPDWWSQTSSASHAQFKATMWRKGFMADYYPSDMMGAQVPVDIVDGRLKIIVTWRYHMINDSKPLDGWLAREHKLRKKDLAEAIVWHELGHNYVTLCLPLRDTMRLYSDHYALFGHVQEFYADMTALRHASPKAARLTMMFRMDELVDYDENEGHTRAAHGIAALLLTEFLTHPDKWPSIHFPPMAPQSDPELNTIRYIYDHMDAEFTLDEYLQLRGVIEKWTRRYGDMVLRGKGKITLPNRKTFMLMAADDRGFKSERDKWVTEQLNKLIAAKRTDPMPANADSKGDDDSAGGTLIARGRTFTIVSDEKPSPLAYLKGSVPEYWSGIEIPW